MSNLEKCYKLILNLLEHKPRLILSYGDKPNKYSITGIEFEYGGWILKLSIGLMPYVFGGHLYSKVTDQDYFITDPNEIDILLNGLKGSFMDWLLEGIDD